MLRLIAFILWLLLLLVSCSKKDQPNVVPGVNVGSINADLTEAELIKAVGRDNVRREQIYIGEGVHQNGHVLYKGTANELELLWDGDYAPPITSVIFRGKGGDWVTDSGIKIGTTIEEINKINGKPFLLNGFDWDYGGYIFSYESGALAKYSGLLVVRLDYQTKVEDDEFVKVIGDQQLSSDNPILAKMDIVVGEIMINLKSDTGTKVEKNGIINAKSGLVMRSEPSQIGEKILSIPFDATIGIISFEGPEEKIGGVTDHWYKVIYKNQVGWVFGVFVDVTE